MAVNVRVSDQALESMVLAACEAYEFGNNNNFKSVETIGHVWGYRKGGDEGRMPDHIYVERLSPCVSAKGTAHSVEFATGVIDLKDSIVGHWSPHLSLLGDFHTHPYESREELVKSKGWNFSKVDKTSFLEDKKLWQRAGNAPISLVMAIAPLERVHGTWGESGAQFRWRFDVGEYRFYLSAAIGGLKKNGESYFKQRRVVNLDLDWRFYNESGNRIRDD